MTEKFNEYANIKYEEFTARGERCDKIMSNLLKVYLVAGYKYFSRYIQQQKDK